jgi:hypothetical protein
MPIPVHGVYGSAFVDGVIWASGGGTNIGGNHGSSHNQVTASAILASEQAGRLLRSDKVNRFLAFPEPAPTVDELIKHSPGSMPRVASHRPPPI